LTEITVAAIAISEVSATETRKTTFEKNERWISSMEYETLFS
jgi:hypothetical protein